MSHSTLLYTVGHSNHTYEQFLQLLRSHGVTFILDVRSVPYSGRAPQFSQRPLRVALRSDGIRYRHAGNVLGGRPPNPEFYDGGQVQYSRMASSEDFQRALGRLRAAAKTDRIALMCAEADPVACHRFLLIARYLRSPDVQIIHILPDGRSEPHAQSEVRLMRETGLYQADLFSQSAQVLEEAYEIQSRRVAFAGRPIETNSEESAR